MSHRCLVCSLALVALSAAAVALAADDKPSDTIVTLRPGDPAPDVEVPATLIRTVWPERKDATTLRLKDLVGKKNVVLYFFIKAKVAGWTIEACGFRDRTEQFAQLDTVVLGVSTDTLRLQEEFSEEQKLNFPLLADAELKATRAFGVRSPVLFAQRKTFIIDKHGTVRKVYENVDFKKHAAEVFAYVKEHLAR